MPSAAADLCAVSTTHESSTSREWYWGRAMARHPCPFGGADDSGALSIADVSRKATHCVAISHPPT